MRRIADQRRPLGHPSGCPNSSRRHIGGLVPVHETLDCLFETRIDFQPIGSKRVKASGLHRRHRTGRDHIKEIDFPTGGWEQSKDRPATDKIACVLQLVRTIQDRNEIRFPVQVQTRWDSQRLTDLGESSVCTHHQLG